MIEEEFDRVEEEFEARLAKLADEADRQVKRIKEELDLEEERDGQADHR